MSLRPISARGQGVSYPVASTSKKPDLTLEPKVFLRLPSIKLEPLLHLRRLLGLRREAVSLLWDSLASQSSELLVGERSGDEGVSLSCCRGRGEGGDVGTGSIEDVDEELSEG